MTEDQHEIYRNTIVILDFFKNEFKIHPSDQLLKKCISVLEMKPY